MTFILVDAANTYSRARHAVRGDMDLKIGMSLHVTFNSIRKAWQDFDGSHVVFCFEGRSWRKDHYAPYKAQRDLAKKALIPKEAEENQIFWETFAQFEQFITEQTNCTVLKHENLEADDLIAGFVQKHPEHNHVIISTDTDFYQLVAPNVKHYNGVTETLTTIDGIFDKKNNIILNKKTKLPVEAPNPEWLLFEKCIRGDTSDNVFSAYPGVRTKGTSKKIGLIDAFNDRHNKGYDWNSIMMAKWVDHNGVDHKVLDDYNRNKLLIDLAAQPEHIRKIIDDVVDYASANPKDLSQVGIRLMKFCALYDLKRMLDSIQMYAAAFQAKYQL